MYLIVLAVSVQLTAGKGIYTDLHVQKKIIAFATLSTTNPLSKGNLFENWKPSDM